MSSADVSALGHNAFVVNRGRQGLSGGTSQSSPIFAAVVALLAQTFKGITGGKSFGFINPLLYSMWAAAPNTFNDVVSGDNVCTERGCHSGCKVHRGASTALGAAFRSGTQ